MRKTFRFIRDSEGFLLELTAGAKRRLWSIAKGPSLDPSHRRIAQSLETSADIVGDVWDQGAWTSSNETDFESGEQFDVALKGGKLHGRWSLARASSGRWTLIKQRDDFAIAGADAHAIDVAFATISQSTSNSPVARSAGSRSGKLSFVPLALASLSDVVPSGPEWIHEVKLDGYRIEAIIDESSIRLMSRNEKDWTSRFPTVVEAIRAMKLGTAILDGEIVAVNQSGVSSFQQLQQSFDSPSSPALRYHVFDLLNLDGHSLLAEPLLARLERLDDILKRVPHNSIVQPAGRFNPAKGNVLDQACKAGEEGVISKRIDARYLAGRGRNWLKIKCGKRQEFVVVGYTDPQGSRLGFGSLLLAVYDNGKFVYTGRVGTGFDTKLLDSIYRKLRALETETNPLGSRPPGIPMRTVHWVTPKLVAEVAFTEWTVDGLLRHPSFKGLREDKRPQQVRREDT